MISELTELQREILDTLSRNIALTRRLAKIIRNHGVSTDPTKHENETAARMISGVSTDLDTIFKKTQREWFLDKQRYTNGQTKQIIKMIEKA